MSKSNLRKIPQNIYLKLNKISSKQIVAGCVKLFTAKEIKEGQLSHLGISLGSGGLIVPDRIMPMAQRGKYSHINRHGQEVIRKDLPKETHYRQMDVPNWGDRWKGTHVINMPYEKYPREFISPALSQIIIEVSSSTVEQASYMFKFEVSEVIEKNDPLFEDRLLRCLNILQENIGLCGVEATGKSLSDYAKTLEISWEILPPGTREEVLTRVAHGRILSNEEKILIEDRYDFLQSLKPNKFIYGTSGLIRYWGALLQDDLVVFENIEYGNAVYIMFEDWAILSRRTRIALMSGKYGKNFERVVHTKGWKGKVRDIIKQRFNVDLRASTLN